MTADDDGCRIYWATAFGQPGPTLPEVAATLACIAADHPTYTLDDAEADVDGLTIDFYNPQATL